MFCKNCGAAITNDAIFCGKCGLKIEQEMMKKKENFGKNNLGKILKIVVIFLMMGIILLVAFFEIKNHFKKDDIKAVNLVLKTTMKNGITYFVINGLHNPEEPDGTSAKWSNGKGSYIYFGNYYQTDAINKEPIRWRVLDIDTLDFGNENAVFLQSDKILDQVEFTRMEDMMGKASYEWTSSGLRYWLNSLYFMPAGSEKGGMYTSGGFLNTAFDEVEKNAIIRSVKPANNDVIYQMYYKDNSGLQSDKVFVLSFEERYNDKYGFLHNEESSISSALEATPYAVEQGVYESAYFNMSNWWLRSKNKHEEAVVGNSSTYVNDEAVGVAPALNLGLKSIAFIVDADYTKSNFGMLNDIKASNSWKLTLFAGEGFIADIKSGNIIKKGGNIDIEVKNLGMFLSSVHYTQISAMLVTEEQEVVCYGKISDEAFIGNITVEIPNDKKLKRGNYNLYIFAEQVNSNSPDQCTDYISNMVTIPVVIQ